jgi:hypothetical protein
MFSHACLRSLKIAVRILMLVLLFRRHLPSSLLSMSLSRNRLLRNLPIGCRFVVRHPRDWISIYMLMLPIFLTSILLAFG